jgi:hypothetical protein
VNDIFSFAKIELAELPSTKKQRLSKRAVNTIPPCAHVLWVQQKFALCNGHVRRGGIVAAWHGFVSRWRSVANSTIVEEGTSIESSMVVQKEVVAAALNDP